MHKESDISPSDSVRPGAAIKTASTPESRGAGRYHLLISCPDGVGIVAAVSAFLASDQGWITESRFHSDPICERFFMRLEIMSDSLPYGLESFRQKFQPIADQFGMTWRLSDSTVKRKVVILVSRQAHCLSDLLHRWRDGELSFEIPAVISNHEDTRGYVEWHGIPFHHVPVSADKREAAFERISEICAASAADVLVLARYMQILPPSLCDTYRGRILNIHHSFLPSFAGGKPYHQAFERGVKLIGATCHYVTDALDEGPIVDQDVIRVSHSDSLEDMIRLGRDVERSVLSRGLRYHLEDRVIIHQNRTVVLI